MIITNSRYTLVGYFITLYPTRAHGIIVIYSRAKWRLLFIYQLIQVLLNFSYSEGRDDGSFSTRIAKLVASTGKVNLIYRFSQA